MNIEWNKRTVLELIICIAIPVLVGCISSALTRNAQIAFVRVAKPPLAPPGWLFPVVWTVLYIAMGLASFLIFESDAYYSRTAICVYVVQLIFNFFWSLIFFRAGTYTFAAIWLGILWVMVVALIVMSIKISGIAFFLLLPYGLWCTFALYLNIGIAVLNK